MVLVDLMAHIFFSFGLGALFTTIGLGKEHMAARKNCIYTFGNHHVKF